MTNNYNTYFMCAKILQKAGLPAFYKGYMISGITYPLYVGIQFYI